MKKNQLISAVALSCVLMVGASTAFAQSDPVLGVKYQTNNQGQRVNTAGSIQGSKDQVNSLGDHVNTAGGVSHLTVADKAINGQVYNDRKVTLVPLRVVFETLDFTVTWKQVAKEIILSNDKNDVVKIKAGKDAHIKNGKAYVSTDFLVKGMKLTVTNEAGHVSIKETP